MSIILPRLRTSDAAATARSLFRHRTYATAAQNLMYDYEEDEYDDVPSSDSERDGPGRSVQWVVVGDPMARRHVYAGKLAKLLGVAHISMGSLVRQELHPQSSLYKQIANAVNQGKLVPEEVIFGLLSKRLEEGYCRGETGFILEGIPRTRIQAEILDQITDVDLVLNFKCKEGCSCKKHVGGSAYCSCPDCFTSGVTKLDLHSTKDQMRKKHRTYAEQRKPVEDYYRKQRKLLDFQVAGAPGETWQGLLAALHLQHTSAAVCSLQKLTA